MLDPAKNSTTKSKTEFDTELERLAGEFVAAVQASTGALPVTEEDSEWPSACVRGPAGEQQVYWSPAKRNGVVDFSGLEQALEIKFPQELVWFYSCFWSGSLPVMWQDRPFELLQLWNAEEEENLRHNFLGHAFEKRRVRQDLSLFFGLIDDQRFLSVQVNSGEVLLEELGEKHPQVVATGLLELLKECTGHLAADQK